MRIAAAFREAGVGKELEVCGDAHLGERIAHAVKLAVVRSA